MIQKYWFAIYFLGYNKRGAFFPDNEISDVPMQ